MRSVGCDVGSVDCAKGCGHGFGARSMECVVWSVHCEVSGV